MQQPLSLLSVTQQNVYETLANFVNSSTFLIAEYYSIIWCTIVYPLEVQGTFGLFQFLAIMKKASLHVNQ